MQLNNNNQDPINILYQQMIEDIVNLNKQEEQNQQKNNLPINMKYQQNNIQQNIDKDKIIPKNI